jgi:hypothetical protein
VILLVASVGGDVGQVDDAALVDVPIHLLGARGASRGEHEQESGKSELPAG